MNPHGKPLDEAWEVEIQRFMDQIEAGELTHAEQLPLARKFAWEIDKFHYLPEGYWLRHDCGTRDCVNPAHAELVALADR